MNLKVIVIACMSAGIATGSFAIAQQTEQAVPADNTKVNQRDKSSETLTPVDQSNKSADIKLAADARNAIIKDGSLSTMAHNVKLVAADGVVTLRGPVHSESEKGKVVALVRAVPGVSRVDDQLDVKTN